MGLDGGTKISRSDVLRGASWRLATADTSRSTRGGAISTTSVHQEQRQKASDVKQNRLSACFLSSSELCCPLVCDFAGTLYNKTSIVEFLLWRKKKLDGGEELQHKYQNIARIHGDSLNHLKGLKDVLDVNLVPQNLVSEASVEVAARSLQPGSVVNLYTMQCPVLQTPFDKERLVLLPPCGHVVSYGLQLMQLEGGSDSTPCPVPGCGTVYTHSEVIELAPETGSVQHKASMERLAARAAQKSLCASSKKRKVKRIECKGEDSSLVPVERKRPRAQLDGRPS